MGLDFRKLNEKTIGHSYPVPNINDILDSIGTAIVYYITRGETERLHEYTLLETKHSESILCDCSPRFTRAANFTLMQSLCFAPCNVIYYFSV